MGSPTLCVVRNEVDADFEYHCDALASRFPEASQIDFPAGERVDPDGIDGVVLTGSTAGVYESPSRPWIDELEAFVRELRDREVPTLGVCFGHQLVNSALGGTVENVGLTARFVAVEFADDPLFDGVAPVVPALHADAVTEPGADMEVIASADHVPAFGTRHRRAPLWTVQFHPELTAAHRDRLREDFGLAPGRFSFEDVSAARLFENFEALVGRSAAVR